MLIQDELRDSGLLAEALRADGHRVIRFTSPILALAHLQSRLYDGLSLPDVLVIDESLRGVSGLDLVCSLRAIGWTKRAILVTDEASSTLRGRADALRNVVVEARTSDLDAVRAVVAAEGE